MFFAALWLLTLAANALGRSVRPTTESVVEITFVATEDAVKHIGVRLALTLVAFEDAFHAVADANLFVGCRRYVNIHVDAS